MRKVLIASALLGLAGFTIYTAYRNIGKLLVNFGDLLPDAGVGNSYVDIEKGLRPKYVVQDGVGGSDFFDTGEGGVTGRRPAEDFE